MERTLYAYIIKDGSCGGFGRKRVDFLSREEGDRYLAENSLEAWEVLAIKQKKRYVYSVRLTSGFSGETSGRHTYRFDSEEEGDRFVKDNDLDLWDVSSEWVTVTDRKTRTFSEVAMEAATRRSKKRTYKE